MALINDWYEDRRPEIEYIEESETQQDREDNERRLQDFDDGE